MTTSTDLCLLSLRDVSDRVKSKDVNPVDVTQAILERIERLNPKVNAYITVMADQAIVDARKAADEIAGGGGMYRGPLHGIPIGVKDLCETAGVRTTAGSKILSDWVPERDATVVTKLREAGAVIVGKLHLHEFAFGATGVNPHYGPARNAYDLERVTGGSSSGSGTAVAAGLCYAALGSDTGGSIRIPSSLCGITGLKPTYGRVSLYGVYPLATSLDHVGPMARSGLDCALLLQAIAGHDTNDRTTANAPIPDYVQQIEGGLQGLRIGVPAQAFAGIDVEVGETLRAAIKKLEDLGATVEEIDWPELFDLWAPGGAITLWEAAQLHTKDIEERASDIGDDVLSRLKLGQSMSQEDYDGHINTMHKLRASNDGTPLKDFDLLALPTTRMAAVRIDAAKTEDPTLGYTRFTAQFDVTGQPAASVPCGWTKEGLPIGLQLVGRHFQEGTVLRAVHAFETQSGVPRPAPALE